ncbi:MBL fold metallo-hydrolase [Botrimarina mediterranea]|uniref:MBL fold metallo-hydrolase n=1 Tax=Botrimarina mediterranea TaxID=2528022 RepID=UPI001187A776|nr:hypothetical protein K2D_05920 [Planctomycetes bacterium K2D]
MDRPDAETAEISLFGNGAGECIVAHLGYGEWIVVDSLRNSQGEPVAKRYLEDLGCNIDRDVKLLVCTHWHDDHCDGIGELFKLASQAKIAVSSAMTVEEFLFHVQQCRSRLLIKETSGLHEMAEVLEELKARYPKIPSPAPHYLAASGIVVYSREAADRPAEVKCLSPSSQVQHDAKQKLGKVLADSSAIAGRLRVPDPNLLSVAVRVKLPGCSLLLGADVPTGATERHGWRSIIDEHSSATHVSSLFKVSHHGSETSWHPPIWDNLLCPNPPALITTFARCGLPKDDQLSKIKSKASAVYVTRANNRFKPKKRRRVDATMSTRVTNRTTTTADPGHIRIRWPLNATPHEGKVELFDDAVQV